MSNKIDGYTPDQWCNDEIAVLVIEKLDDNGEVERTVKFKKHYCRDSPSWPPLGANGDQWHIEKTNNDESGIDE